MNLGKPKLKQLNVWYSKKKKKQARIFFKASTSVEVVSEGKAGTPSAPMPLGSNWRAAALSTQAGTAL